MSGIQVSKLPTIKFINTAEDYIILNDRNIQTTKILMGDVYKDFTNRNHTFHGTITFVNPPYLPPGTETDPIFIGSPAYNITDEDIYNWNQALGWGNHNSEGYIKFETDPVFMAHVASTITSMDILHWNKAYGWGDHSLQGYLTQETDPIYTSSSWYATVNNSVQWDTAYGWGDHSVEGYLKEQDVLDILSGGNGGDTYLKVGDDVSLLVNDVPYLVEADVINILNGTDVDGNPIPGSPVYLKEGDNVSLLVNDPGYLTEVEVENILNGLNPDGSLNSGSGSYLQVGDPVSDLDNDAGYLTESEVNNILAGFNPDGSANPGSPGYLKPGDDVTELVNDAGYITGVATLNEIGDVDSSMVPLDGQFLIRRSGNWTAETSALVGSPISFIRVIDTSVENAPVATDGDLYIQHSSSGGSVTALGTWTGIAGQTIEEGQTIIYGSDNNWHVGGSSVNVFEVQADYLETDNTTASYIRNKPFFGDGLDYNIPTNSIKVEAADNTVNVGINGISVNTNNIGIGEGNITFTQRNVTSVGVDVGGTLNVNQANDNTIYFDNVDTLYTAGNGLQLSPANEFSVKSDPNNSNIIVGPDGISVDTGNIGVYDSTITIQQQNTFNGANISTDSHNFSVNQNSAQTIVLKNDNDNTLYTAGPGLTLTGGALGGNTEFVVTPHDDTIKVETTGVRVNTSALGIPFVGTGEITIKQPGTTDHIFNVNQDANYTISLRNDNTTYTGSNGVELTGTNFTAKAANNSIDVSAAGISVNTTDPGSLGIGTGKITLRQGAVDTEFNVNQNNDQVIDIVGSNYDAGAGLLLDTNTNVFSASVDGTTIGLNAANQITNLNADGSGQIGTIGYWNRTGTTLSPVNTGDSVDIGSFVDTSDTGAGCGIQSGGLISSQRALATSGTSDVYRGYHGNTITSSIQADGSIKIGGTIPSAPNIELRPDGSATFAGHIQAASATFYRPTTDGNNDILALRSNVGGTNVIKSQFFADGSATFAGKVTSVSTEASDPDTTLTTKDYVLPYDFRLLDPLP